MFFTIKKFNGIIFKRTLSRGWNYIGASLGAFMLPSGSIRLTNGVCNGDGAGTIFFDTIEIRRTRWESPRLYGNGNESIIPRGSFRMRDPTAPLPRAALDFGYANGPRIPFSPSLRVVSPWWTYPPTFKGMYRIIGERQRDAPGGRGIEPISGFEGDAQGILSRSDAMMNRSPLDAFTTVGTMLQSSPGYNDDVGWQKSTQLAPFAVPLTANMYDDRRKPKEWNTGTCPYYNELVGFPNPYDSLLPSNQQHGIRTIAPVLAAANCGDELAQMDLDVIAHNARLAVSTSPSGSPGRGSTYYGTRAADWRIWAWMHSGVTHSLADGHITQTLAVQMPNGGFMNQPYPSWFSPDPWNNYGLPQTSAVEATMERWLTCHVLAAAGQVAAVRKSLAGIFDTIVPNKGYVPKFVVVAKNNTIESVIRDSAGPADYFPWVALGALAALEPQAEDWKRWSLTISTPSQGKATTLKELRDKLRVEQLGRSQIVAILSVLETLNL